MPENEKEKGFKGFKPKKKRRDNAAKALQDKLFGNPSFVDDLSTKHAAARVGASFVKDKENPKEWYIKYVNITPAKNISRPMEPIFNTAVTRNATTGVPKFVELDVEWKHFADTFMMDQVCYAATQQVRLNMKSNLMYDERRIKACLVNGLALTIAGKMMERDVHWNLYTGSSDFNFAKMYKYQNQTVGTFGKVALYPKNYLLDENLPYTSTIYNKIVSLSNQVLKLPKRIAEFASHYFGSLFTLDKDGHNDQYLKVNMHEIDYFTGENFDELVSLDLAAVDLDQLLSLLNQYSKDFAVVLADLQKCLGVHPVLLQRYESYTYAFVYDKALLQALINGYTDKSAIVNNYVRLDQLEGVSDDLTQYLFLGGIQPSDDSKSNVHAIRILDMVLKANADTTISWPTLFEQRAINSDIGIEYTQPVGLSITTNFVIDDTYRVEISTSSETTTIPIPVYPYTNPTLASITGINHKLGLSAGTQFPASPWTRLVSVEDRTLAFQALVLVDSVIIKVNDSEFYLYAWFAGNTPFTYGSIDPSTTYSSAVLNKIYRLRAKFSALSNIYAYLRDICNNSDPSMWFMTVLPSDVPNSILNHLYQNSDLDLADTAGITEETVTVSPLNTIFVVRYRRYVIGVGEPGFSAYLKCPSLVDIEASWTTSTTTVQKFSIPAPFQPAPAGIFGQRVTTVNATSVSNDASASAVAGGESVAFYVAQVVDYHIPVAYKRVIHFSVDGDGITNSINLNTAPMFTLIKEDYIPYLYNVMDLIPVLYEMFVSLFSIDNLERKPSR